jgi:6-pyruvoyltetrahydropterin/6-carboxytetrahydropterin synthase
MVARIRHTAASGFESARHVSLLPEGHRSRRTHGHSFLAKVRASLPNGFAAFPGGETAALQAALERCTAGLDYRLLNDVIGQPTDENLARWIRERIDVPGLEQVGIQSTQHEGVDLDAGGTAHIWRRYAFQAAHQLPNVPPGHKCGRMHGHGFEVIIHAQVDAGKRDITIDFDHLDTCWAPIHAELSFQCLNDIPGFENPTSERISSYLWARLKNILPELSWVTVYETASCGANFNGSQYRIWKEFTLDSALRLKRAPEGSAMRRIHGHTYVLRLHLSAPLDELAGWTVDFGDVKEKFSPIFKSLDHQPLHEIPQLADCDAGSIANYILQTSQAVLPSVDRVDIFETRGVGAIAISGTEGPAIPI